MDKYNDYTIGGEIYKLESAKDYSIKRATSVNTTNITNILIKCLDDSIDNKLGFDVVSDEIRDMYIDRTKNSTARSYATLCINKQMTIEQQRKLVEKSNAYISVQREKYNSLFLTNYRESNLTIARKRISFDLAFKICNHILNNLS